jgi:hypothetical protein
MAVAIRAPIPVISPISNSFLKAMANISVTI